MVALHICQVDLCSVRLLFHFWQISINPADEVSCFNLLTLRPGKWIFSTLMIELCCLCTRKTFICLHHYFFLFFFLSSFPFSCNMEGKLSLYLFVYLFQKCRNVNFEFYLVSQVLFHISVPEINKKYNGKIALLHWNLLHFLLFVYLIHLKR